MILRRILDIAPLTLAVLATAGTGFAQAEPFVHPDGRTRWFDVVVAPTGGITYDAAHAAAAKAGGALASITHTAENDFVFAMAQTRGAWVKDSNTGQILGPWLGGVQYAGASEPAGSWAWASLETMSYKAWAPGQPDDDGGADRLHYVGATNKDATWGDAPATRKLPGYVIEFDGPRTQRTVGLMVDEPGHEEGYTLYNPLRSTFTPLIDDRGRLVHFWTSQYTPGAAAYILPNGNLLRAGALGNSAFSGVGGGGGIVEEFSWDGQLVWSYKLSNATEHLHHDFVRLPNGNTVMIAWEKITGAEAIANGRDPNLLSQGELWPDKLVEVDPNGKVVWEWRAWDHIVQDFDATKKNYGDVSKSPDRIDLNHGAAGPIADWLHSNALAYNEKLDQLVLSVRYFDEIWIIDHSTTTAEAKTDKGGRSGKGGRLLYRWGNPRTYRAGTKADQQLFHQHDSHWIPAGLSGAGDLLIFSNGNGRAPFEATTIVQITPPTPDANGNYPRTGAAWGPKVPTWIYPTSPTKDFYSAATSGVQRLRNGNTLICSSWEGRVFEVTPAGQKLWEYEFPFVAGNLWRQGDVPAAGGNGNSVFRAPRYYADEPALKGRKLTPLVPLESAPDQILVDGSTVPARMAPGETADLTIHAPTHGGASYLMFTSATTGVIPLDYRHVPVGYDSLLLTTLLNQAPAIFSGYTGNFDASGRAAARIALPDIGALVGLELHTSYLIVDFNSLFGVPLIGNAVTVEVVR